MKSANCNKEIMRIHFTIISMSVRMGLHSSDVGVTNLISG